MKIVFMGTPGFALPSVKLLFEDDFFEIQAILTQPDKPAGRGKKLTESPVKIFAKESNIKVYQPVKIREDQELLDILRSLNPDAFVTVAFGQILSREVLDIPKFGTINLHASLLPKYRGANPIQWSLINGDPVTGVTTMLTEEGVDCGDMLLIKEVPVLPEYDTLSLTQVMADQGSYVLAETLKKLYKGELIPVKQDGSMATKAPKLKKDFGNINWQDSAVKIHNIIRGSKPSPGAYTSYNGTLLKLHGSFISESQLNNEPGEPGNVVEIIKNAVRIATGSGIIDLTDVQPPNKPKMKASDWARGSRIQPGDKLTRL